MGRWLANGVASHSFTIPCSSPVNTHTILLPCESRCVYTSMAEMGTGPACSTGYAFRARVEEPGILCCTSQRSTSCHALHTAYTAYTVRISITLRTAASGPAPRFRKPSMQRPTQRLGRVAQNRHKPLPSPATSTGSAPHAFTAVISL